MGIVKEVGGAHLSQSVGVAVGNEGQWEKKQIPRYGNCRAHIQSLGMTWLYDTALLGGNGIKDHWRGA